MAQSTLSQSPASNAAITARHRKRQDIQGLRAIAVIAVIFDHLLHWPSGGFVGVDVFFVISGFLITGLLLREHDKTGSISFKNFYLRRIRRILPAAVTVLLATTAASFALFNVVRAQQTTIDAVWSFFFSGNWRFASTGTDYFQAAGPVSPLQHFWSLAVEEQFYFIWPWLMLLIFFLAGRAATWNTARARKAITIAMCAIIAFSFAWALAETVSNPAVAYFSTVSRTWELGVGALLAIFVSTFRRIPDAFRPVLAWLGLAGIVWSIFTISDDSAFPAPWAAAPVLATALVIAAGTGGQQRFLAPLTNRVSSYLGDISYSLYLWHFPVIILLASVFPESDLLFVPLALALMITLSVAAYHFIEKRVLDSTWLDYSDSAQRERRRRKRNKPQHLLKDRLQWAALGVLAIVTAGVTVHVLIPSPTLSAGTASIAETAPSETPVTSANPASSLGSQVSSALAANSWPELDPAIGAPGSQRVPQWTENNCIKVTDENFDACSYGPSTASKTAVVFGDSVAVSWLPAVIGALEPLGYKVQAVTLSSCPVGAVQVSSSTSANQLYQECSSHLPWALERINALNPNLIIMSDAPHTLRRLISKNTGEEAVNEYQQAYVDTLKQLPKQSKLVTLATPPGAKDTQACYTPLSKPADCTSPLGEDWKNLSRAEESASKVAGAAYINTQAWFCAQGQCPAFVGKTPLYVDSLHLTAASSAMLAPVVADALTEANVLTP